jgi:aryl-alcohol dehydrogenase-like predicted oxidoreductase
MKTNLLGGTGIEISDIALGGGATGGLFTAADEMTRIIVLKRAIAAGINWIDTAPAYGDGASETGIGRHLNGLAPQPHISTKVLLDEDDLGDIAGAIERSLDGSLTRLRTDHVTLLLLHNQLGEGVGGRLALAPEQVLGPGGVADTFDRLKEHGLIDACGITATGSAAACLEVIDSGRFDCAQVYYNANNPSAAWSRAPPGWKAQDFSGMIAACFDRNMGVLAVRIWAGGPLANLKPPERLSVLTAGTDLDNEMRCAAAVHAVLGDTYGTPAQAALRFALNNRDLSTRVLGIGDHAFLDEALVAVEKGALPSAAVGKLGRLWATDFYQR